MGRRSSIQRLDPKIVAEINSLLERGRTLDEILSALRNIGVSEVSRSALGRYKQSYDEIIASVRESRQVAEVLVKEFGTDTEPKAMRANIEMLQALVSRLGREITRGETLDVKQIAILSGALESLGRASKTDVEMMAKMKEEARKEAEKKVEEATRKAAAESAGLTPEQALERMKAIYRGEA